MPYLGKNYILELILRAANKNHIAAYKLNVDLDNSLPGLMICMPNGRTLFVYTRTDAKDISNAERKTYEELKANKQSVYIVTSDEVESFITWILEEVEAME
nr:MAG TPA: hydrolase [Caudoviricetes sp.]